MSKTNKFHVKEIKDEVNVTVEEERKDHSPFFLLFKRNKWLWYVLFLLLALIISIITIYAISKNLGSSKKVEYDTSGVLVSFDEENKSILNGVPITEAYASKLFDTSVSNEINRGVVIKVKEVAFELGKIIFYSDKTALIKYDNGNYVKVKALNNDYGVEEDGTIKSKAEANNVSYESKDNNDLGIKLLYLSDGTVEITKDNMVFLLRNTDLTSKPEEFYTNLSGVSAPIKEEESKKYYSDGTIKEDNYLIVDGTKHYPTKEEIIHDDIKIIYYDNGYAEVIQGDLDIIVQKSEHIKYDDNIFEIVDGTKEVNIKDFIDIKSLELNNKNNKEMNYIIVLEETDNYAKHKASRRLPNEYVNYSIYLNGNKANGTLDNNIKDSSKYEGLNLSNNTYLLYEGKLKSLEQTDIKIGLWISYENITNEYMNSALIGTLKVYVEE